MTRQRELLPLLIFLVNRVGKGKELYLMLVPKPENYNCESGLDISTDGSSEGETLSFSRGSH